MTENSFEALEERLARVEAAIHAIEARLAIETPVPAPVTMPSPEPQPQGMDMALIGKSVLVIGGAYVLRALTELHVLGPIAGVILALVYALFWIWAADRDLSRGLRVAALFHAGTAALIAGPLLWESTTRFHLLAPALAIALVLGVSSGLLAIALHQRSTTMALIAAILATMTSIGIAIGTLSFTATLVATTLFGVLLSWLSLRSHWPMYVTLIPAAASDMLALPLIVMCAIGKVPVANVELALVAFAVAWLFTPATWTRGQAVVATLLGLGGASFLAAFHSGHPQLVAAACLTIAAGAYVACSLRHSIALLIAGAIAALAGSLLVLSPLALAIAWASGAVVSAAIGKRTSWIPMHLHATVWSIAAAVAAGLPTFFASAFFSSLVIPASSRLPLIVAGVLAAVTLWLIDSEARRSRLALLAICAMTLLTLALASAGAMSSNAVLATVRTGAIALVAFVLSLLSRKIGEAQTLAWILLVFGGVKLLAQDLAIGNATSLVVGLALYGGAIVLVAHRRGNHEVS